MANLGRDYYAEIRDIIEDWLESGIDDNELIKHVENIINDYEAE